MLTDTTRRDCMTGGKTVFFVETENEKNDRFFGRLVHYYDGSVYRISDEADILLKINAIMDRQGFCVEKTTLKSSEKILRVPEKEPRKENLKEYRASGKNFRMITIYNRQNYSLQGELVQNQQKIRFKSGLELLAYLKG